MGGFIAAEVAIAASRTASRSWSWSPPPGIIERRGSHAKPAEAVARMLAATAPLGAASSRSARSAARASRDRAFAQIFRHPRELRRELLWEQFVHGAAQSPGFVRALTSLLGYDIRDRLEEIEVPTLIVWGRERPDRPVRRRRRVRRAARATRAR